MAGWLASRFVGWLEALLGFKLAVLYFRLNNISEFLLNFNFELCIVCGIHELYTDYCFSKTIESFYVFVQIETSCQPGEFLKQRVNSKRPLGVEFILSSHTFSIVAHTQLDQKLSSNSLVHTHSNTDALTQTMKITTQH